MATSVVRIGVESTGRAYRGPAKGSVATRGGPDRCAGPVRSGGGDPWHREVRIHASGSEYGGPDRHGVSWLGVDWCRLMLA